MITTKMSVWELHHFVTTEGARKLLKLRSRKSVTAALREHRLMGVRVGRLWLIAKSEVSRYRVSRVHQANGCLGGRPKS